MRDPELLHHLRRAIQLLSRDAGAVRNGDTTPARHLQELMYEARTEVQAALRLAKQRKEVLR